LYVCQHFYSGLKTTIKNRFSVIFVGREDNQIFVSVSKLTMLLLLLLFLLLQVKKKTLLFESERTKIQWKITCTKHRLLDVQMKVVTDHAPSDDRSWIIVQIRSTPQALRVLICQVRGYWCMLYSYSEPLKGHSADWIADWVFEQ
jgi:hypothetical protein